MARTPPDFTFDIKALSLLTGQPARVSALYADLRPDTGKRTVYPADLPAAHEEVWSRFLTALDPLVAAGKLGAVLFQFPPWFTIRRRHELPLLRPGTAPVGAETTRTGQRGRADPRTFGQLLPGLRAYAQTNAATLTTLLGAP